MTSRKVVLRKPPRSILLISYGGHGDILLTTPLITSLKNAFPDAVMDVYVQDGRNAMLSGNPLIREVFVEQQRHGLSSYLEFFRQHTARYDLAVSPRTSDRQVLFARAAGRRAISMVPSGGSGRLWKQAVLNGSVRTDGEQHVALDMLRLADRVGAERVLACRPPSDSGSEKRLHELLPFDWESEPYAIMHLVPRNRYKEWTLDRWAAVARHLRSRNLHVILVGHSSEYEMQCAAALAKEVPDAVLDLTGKTSFADSAMLLGHCRAYVGADTAMTHLAAAVEAPTVALFGFSNSQYSPYHAALSGSPYRAVSPQRLRSAHVQVVLGACQCRPGEAQCERQAGEYSACMHSICSDFVIAALDDILAAPRA